MKYPSPPSSSTKLGKIGDGRGGLSSIFNLPSMVLELDGLGYFTKYPSPPSSGTIVGHQVPYGLWPTKLLIIFFLFTIVGETSIVSFLIFFFIYTVC